MSFYRLLLVVVLFVGLMFVGPGTCDNSLMTVRRSPRIFPGTGGWSLDTRMPMTTSVWSDSEEDEDYSYDEGRGKLKKKFKKFKKFMLPLLLAYKLKFFTLIPVLIGGLILLTGATGLAGFFFALFAAVMGLKTGGHHH